MRKCEKCQAYIYHTHGNTKYCDRCKHVPKAVYQEQTVSVPISKFNKMQADSELIEKIKELLL